MPTIWASQPNPKHTSFPVHGSAIITSLLISHERIITASDDHSIHVYSPTTGALLHSLDGHEGGVWALAARRDTLVSGSTDRTVRIWDLATGRCTHVFGAHRNTVRCLSIVNPEWVQVEGEGGVVTREKWPKRALVVTGSRDRSMRVWNLPRVGEGEHMYSGPEDARDPTEDTDENPFFVQHLMGHTEVVHAIAARGRVLISGSYDSTVRVWDLITGECQLVLEGHKDKVYSVSLDLARNRAYSSSMDATVRIWDLHTGQCTHKLTRHDSLVGLLALSPSHLVSASADSTLRVWDPSSGELQHTLSAPHAGAVTCFMHDECKVVSGSEGTLKLWDVRDGRFLRDLLTGATGIWQVAFVGRWCVAASNRDGATTLEIWDFEEGDPVQDEHDDGSEVEEEGDNLDIDGMVQNLQLF